MNDIQTYLNELEPQRKTIVEQIIARCSERLPKGFELTMQCNMPSFVVPLSTYPHGYHCSPNTPLPFLSIASQKQHIALYHLGIYAVPSLMEWFLQECSRQNCTISSGKSCLRFNPKKPIPFDTIGELVTKVNVSEWIALYEQSLPESVKRKRT